MMTPETTWLGLDIGGANLKAYHPRAGALTVPFALWKHPDQLTRKLAELIARLPPAGRFAVTMTAELCDCYPTKAAGVREILECLRSVVPEPFTRLWGIDGRFHEIDEIEESPHLAAAANWLALATVAARLVPEGPGLLIDIGTTTSDLIPLRDGRVAAIGRTDTERLRTGELLYAGIARTPVCALATELPWRGAPIGLAAELFATTKDVYVLLGDIPPDPFDRETADGHPRTTSACVARLARMVGSDADGFTHDDAVALARAADDALMARLVVSGGNACAGAGIERPRVAIVSGSGALLARRLAERLVPPPGTIRPLADAWGPEASEAACAYALVQLATECP